MKNQKGFIVPLLLGIIALLIIGGGIYVYEIKKAEAPAQTPPVDTTTNNLSSKTYTNTKQGYSFEYPTKLSLSTSGEVVNLSHSIPFENRGGGCDMKGDAELSKNLTDFDLSIKVVSGAVNPPYVDGSYSKGILNGKWAYMGVEGCGQTSYYFPITGNRTLVIEKAQVQMLSDVATPETRAKILAVPGVISNEESKIIFDQILSTFKLMK